ncbi:hypothetical protein GGR77_001543 [Xanthomonas translucens]
MDSKTIRRLNFAELVRNAGGDTAFSNAYGGGRWSPSLINRWVNGSKGIGDAVARAIEAEAGLSHGSLDRPGDGLPQPEAARSAARTTVGAEAVVRRPDPRLLVRAHEILTAQGRYDLATVAGAEALAAAYEVASRMGGSNHFDAFHEQIGTIEREQGDIASRAAAEADAAPSSAARKVSTRTR